MTATRTATIAGTLPVVEVFGPTIQGEGPHAGRPVTFVRLGGCDFRCAWCDSPHAVDPEQVRAAQRLTPAQTAALVAEHETGTPLPVVLSGGNPALHPDRRALPLIDLLRPRPVHVETQGTIWRDWLHAADQLVISPKPPSAGMGDTLPALRRFLRNPHPDQPAALKVVVFDHHDLAYLRQVVRVAADYHRPVYASAGTSQHPPDTIQTLADRYRWLCEQVAADPYLAGVAALPQLHVIAWGHARGV